MSDDGIMNEGDKGHVKTKRRKTYKKTKDASSFVLCETLIPRDIQLAASQRG